MYFSAPLILTNMRRSIEIKLNNKNILLKIIGTSNKFLQKDKENHLNISSLKLFTESQDFSVNN